MQPDNGIVATSLGICPPPHIVGSNTAIPTEVPDWKKRNEVDVFTLKNTRSTIYARHHLASDALKIAGAILSNAWCVNGKHENRRQDSGSPNSASQHMGSG
jgi:hypothetical protein